MFLQEGPHGTMILYIPSVFISYNGEALDEKSVLLKSSSVISKVALEVLNLIEPIEDGKHTQLINSVKRERYKLTFFFLNL